MVTRTMTTTSGLLAWVAVVSLIAASLVSVSADDSIGDSRHPKDVSTTPASVVDADDLDDIWQQTTDEVKLYNVGDEPGDDDAELEEEWSKTLVDETERMYNVGDEPGDDDADLEEEWQQSVDEETGDAKVKVDDDESILMGEDEEKIDDNEFHADCIEAWGELSNNTDDRGCASPQKIEDFHERCPLPELAEQVSEMMSKCEENEGQGRKMFMAITTDVESDEMPEVTSANGTAADNSTVLLSRRRRFTMTNPLRLWPGGKVPFIDGDSQGNIRAMKTFERFTCIRFFPWSEEDGVTTNDKLGLDHQSYLKFIWDGGCWSSQGNRRSSSGGQSISCCGGIVCVHEIGHALGAYHEHQNPLGKGQIRLNPQNAQTSKIYNFKEAGGEGTYSVGFDMNSIMGYGKTTFSNGNGEVISYSFSDIGGGSDWYYLLMEISNAHKCDELYCSDYPLTCINDGYLTLVDNKCGCMCPPGLDPRDGCRTPLTDGEVSGGAPAAPAGSDMGGADDMGGWLNGPADEEVSVLNGESSDSPQWPSGQYGLPQVSEGCPSDQFSEGSRVETGDAPGECADKTTRGCAYWKRAYTCHANPGFMYPTCPVTCELCHTFGNHQSEGFHLSGTTTNDQAEHSFCVKENAGDDTFQWPPGQYCLYKVGGSCPPGFDSGSATFSDAAHSSSANSESGSLPDGEYTDSSTKFEFCCTKYGFIEDELILPRTKPFALLMSSDEKTCHKVRGMHSYTGYTVVKNADGAPVLEGDTPVRAHDSSHNTYKIPYCYYAPTGKDGCSELIELTDENPTATFSGESKPEQGCNWLIKGPENTRVMLKFSEFNVAKDAKGYCEDKVTVRYNRLAQPGKEYCGDSMEKTISTVNNTLHVTYETFTTGDSSFTATVTLISQKNLCYSVADKGHSYAGVVSRTRALKTCIPWTQAGHCPHSPFKDGDMTDGLQNNYCRNPDTVDGVRPWCYTQADGCLREYCDVCLFESLFDTLSPTNCEILVGNGLCENDPEGATAFCAKTCASNGAAFPEPTLANDVTCSAPSEVADGDIVGEVKASYNVGEVVTYTCKDANSPSSKERRCLTTGEWSSLNVVCTECELGWSHLEGNCYILTKENVEHWEAVEACEAMGAQLVTAKTEKQIDFLSNMSFWHGSWLAASDSDSEGDWVWSDGEAFSWSRWSSGQPDNWHNEDCVWMTRDGYMEDRWCSRDTQAYICVKAENTVSSCDDVTDDCANFYANDATSCSTQSDFMHRNCKKTCGLCGTTTCNVEDPTANAQKSADTDVSSIDQGAYVTYECKEGFKAVRGDAIRGCLPDGSMTGESLECAANNEVSTSQDEMKYEGSWGSKRYISWPLTGRIPGFIIPKDGKITKWKFYSANVGQAALQVWRPTDSDYSMTFVGQNIVKTPDDMTSTYYVPEAEQIEVKEGDVLGINYLDSSKPIGYTKCDLATRPGADNIKYISSKTSSFTVGQLYSFTDETSDTCRIWRFTAIIS